MFMWGKGTFYCPTQNFILDDDDDGRTVMAVSYLVERLSQIFIMVGKSFLMLDQALQFGEVLLLIGLLCADLALYEVV